MPIKKKQIADEFRDLYRQGIHYLSDISNLTALVYWAFSPTFLLLAIFILRQSGGISPGERGLDMLEIVLTSVVSCSVFQVLILSRIAVVCLDSRKLPSGKNIFLLLIAITVIALMLSFIFRFVTL